jgi:UDP-N-acetylglucosamine 1-carboxyvinyltransferase
VREESAMAADAWRIVGGRPLRGAVGLSGSKNGALPTLAATLLVDGETVLENVPRITDVGTMLGLLRGLGLGVEERSDGSVRIVNDGITTHRPPAELVGLIRASHYVLGPLALRLGRAEVPLPGGCQIGARPVSHFLAVLEALGVRTGTAGGRIALEASGLKGGVVVLDPRHRNAGATFTGLMAASLAEGESTIEHASFEPDVVRFCEFLNAAGARVEGVGTPTLVVRGVGRLRATTHRINSDRLEAGTLICAAAATRGEVTVEGITREELGETLDKLEEAGVVLSDGGGRGLTAGCPERPRGVGVVTDPFPSFSTDLQPPVAAVLVGAEGRSTIRETVYDGRLQYADELGKMGADITVVNSREAVIRGVPRLRGAMVEARNIRDGAAMVIAALSAEGESVVSGRQFVARGYEEFERKLRSLGAQITTAGEEEG